MTDIIEKFQPLQDASECIQLQIAAVKISSKIHQIKEEQFLTALKEALEENPNVLGSLKLLSQEAEGWKKESEWSYYTEKKKL